MNWREIQPQIRNKPMKFYTDLALACFDAAASFSTDEYVLETVALIRNDLVNKVAIRDRHQTVKLLRVNTENKNAKEVAHIVLHLIETVLCVNDISASGHTARCVEALGRVHSILARDVLNKALGA